MQNGDIQYIEIANYTISKQDTENEVYPEGMIWIQKHNEEGMSIHAKEFYRLIDAYFKEKF